MWYPYTLQCPYRSHHQCFSIYQHRMVILQDSYILDRLNHRITNIFRKENIPVRVSHIPYILRQALSYNTTERTRTRDKCSISNTKLCLRRNGAYQFTCNNCTQQYIGSTTRFIHDLREMQRIREPFVLMTILVHLERFFIL